MYPLTQAWHFFFFFWLRQVLIAACGIFSLHCSIQDFLVAACGIYFPDQGSNRGPLHYECRVLATGPPREVPSLTFLDVSAICSPSFRAWAVKACTGTAPIGPLQGTWIQSLVWEGATSHRATKPMSHIYWAHMPQLEKACTHQWRPSAAKNK